MATAGGGKNQPRPCGCGRRRALAASEALVILLQPLPAPEILPSALAFAIESSSPASLSSSARSSLLPRPNAATPEPGRGNALEQIPLAAVESESFVTNAQRLYIEDTDAYGVIYNANYLRAYDRALHGIGIAEASGDGDGDDRVIGGGDGGHSVLTHEDWYVTEITRQKFRASPPMGGQYVVAGRLAERSVCGTQEVWDMRMTSPTPEGEGGDGEEKVAVIYNSATVTIAKPDDRSGPSLLLPPKPSPFPRADASVEYAYVPYRDEYDLHLGPTHLPLRSCLNLFERARSDFLGGPGVLKRMLDEDKIVWAVTRVERCSLVNIGHKRDEEDERDDVRCVPGGEVIVKMDPKTRRRGAVIECWQTLLVRSVTGRRRRLAQAVITIMALDEETRRPARKIPGWFSEKIEALAGKGT